MIKKLSSLFFALFSTCLCHSLYVGNPASPEIIEKGLFISSDSAYSVKAGYQGDFVFNRNAEAHGHVHGDMDSFTIYRNQGVVTFNAFDRAELYGSVGAMQVYLSDRPFIDGKRREYDFHNQFTWGGGGRVIVFEWGKVCFGADGKYQQAGPSLRWAALNGASVPSHSTKLAYREWQVSAAFSYDAGLLIPYIGAAYSQLNAQVKHISSNLKLGGKAFHMGNREHFGLALGSSLSNGEIIDLTVELRFFDEQSLTLAGNIKF